MLLVDLMPEALDVIRERAKKEQLKRILTNKLKCEPSKEIVKLVEEATEEQIREIEDKIFEIESWEELEKCLVVSYFK